MKSLNTIENKVDYLIVIISYIFLFITIKQIIPIYIYALFALLISLYFFPLRLIINLNKKKSKVNLVITGLIFSILLTFSILNLYIPNDNFIKYTIYAMGLLNFAFMIYYYLKHNQFLLLNFLFIFFSSVF